MKLVQLKLFRDIAYEKSFVKTAQLNFMTQPSVSIHLKQLEEELGVKLFDRVPRKVSLTPEGKIYLQHAEEILNKCDSLLAIGGALRKSPKGEIRIASIHSIGMYELGSFLRSFMSRYPGIRIHLEYQDSYRVYELVQKRKAHLGMVAYPEKRLSIDNTFYGKDELCLAIPSSHPLAQEAKVTLANLNNQSFISFDSNTPTQNHIDKLLKAHQVKIRTVMTNNNVFALKKAVEAGLGVSIVPWRTLDDEVRQGTIKRVRIVGQKIFRPLAIITLKNITVSQVTKIFMDTLTAYDR